MPPIVDDLTCGDNLITMDRDKASTLAEIFFPALPATNLPIHRKIDATLGTARPPGALGFSPITIGELRKACAKMRNTIATGPNDLSILIVKRCFRELKTFSQLVFNACLKLGFFPSQWKHAKVLALHKPGKD